MSFRDNNPIQLTRMELQLGKSRKMIAPLVQRYSNSTTSGDPRSQSLETRQRSSGWSTGLRGVNTRLENTGKESKLVNLGYRNIVFRRRTSPSANLIRTPQKQTFGIGERPFL